MKKRSRMEERCQRNAGMGEKGKEERKESREGGKWKKDPSRTNFCTIRTPVTPLAYVARAGDGKIKTQKRKKFKTKKKPEK